MQISILLAVIVGSIAVECLTSKSSYSDGVLPVETKENGDVNKKGIPALVHSHGFGHEYNQGWGWGSNDFVSDYGFKIGPHGKTNGHGDGWNLGWTGQSYNHYNPGWTSNRHGHGHPGHLGSKHNY